jgi:hypothetical protein
VHPRSDQRHITPTDVREITAELAPLRGRVEFNIEGDPRPDFVELVADVRPDQCTLVPVRQGEITSQAGWLPETKSEALRAAIDRCRSLGIRVSLFVDPDDMAIGWAGSMGADRVELYTEPFARAFEAGDGPAQPPPPSRPMPVRPGWRPPWVWASTPGTTWTLGISRCFAGCRTWPRSRSATPSSAMPCTWASTAASATICRRWRIR